MTRLKTKSSNTAKLTCFQRALGHSEVGSPIANDYIALHLLSPKVRAEIIDAGKRKAHIERVSPTYSYINARNAHMDRMAREAVENGFDQIVIMGAGYDTTAYRLLADCALQVFEVDAPTSQADKKKYLATAGIAAPENLHYIAIDFNEQSLSDVMLASGYNATGRTLFIWEGVTYYISAEAVDGTLGFIQQHSAAGSVVAFDYIYADVCKGNLSYYGAQEGVAYVASVGEPFTYGIEPTTLETFLAERGYELAEHYTGPEFQARYLSEERFPRAYEYMGNVVAVTK